MYANLWMFPCFLPLNFGDQDDHHNLHRVFSPLGFVPRSYQDTTAESMEPNVVTCHLGDEMLNPSQVVELPFWCAGFEFVNV